MYTQNNHATRVANCVTPRQLQVMNTLRRLWMEHVFWTRSFENLLMAHLQIAAQLVNAAKAGDAAAAQQARQQWYANAANIAAFLARANPYWNQADWQAMLFEHLRMTENEAVQQLTGRYADSITQYDAIQNQALEMADVMAQGIIQQFRL